MPDQATETTSPRLQVARLVIDAGRVIAWPLLISVMVLVYHGPVRAVLESLALKFAEASKVSIGSLSLEVQEKAREAGNPELARQVGTLSPAAVEQLMLTPRDGGMVLATTGDFFGKRAYGLPGAAAIGALKELEGKRFIQFTTSFDAFAAKLRTLKRAPFFQGSEREWFLAGDPADSPGDKELRQEEYSLTDLGRQAASAIVKAVGEQLGRH